MKSESYGVLNRKKEEDSEIHLPSSSCRSATSCLRRVKPTGRRWRSNLVVTGHRTTPATATICISIGHPSFATAKIPVDRHSFVLHDYLLLGRFHWLSASCSPLLSLCLLRDGNLFDGNQSDSRIRVARVGWEVRRTCVWREFLWEFPFGGSYRERGLSDSCMKRCMPHRRTFND